VEEGENKVVCGICGKDIRCLGGSLMPVPWKSGSHDKQSRCHKQTFQILQLH